MRIGLLLVDAPVLLSEADEIEAQVVQDSGSTGYNLFGGTVKPWINGTYFINVDMSLLKPGKVEVRFRTQKDGIFSEWYSQVAFHNQ